MQEYVGWSNPKKIDRRIESPVGKDDSKKRRLKGFRICEPYNKKIIFIHYWFIYSFLIRNLSSSFFSY